MKIVRASEGIRGPVSDPGATWGGGNFDLPSGEGFPYHRHIHHEELIGVTTGEVELCLEGEQFTLGASDFVVVERGEAHSLAVRSARATGWFLKFPNLPTDRISADSP